MISCRFFIAFTQFSASLVSHKIVKICRGGKNLQTVTVKKGKSASQYSQIRGKHKMPLTKTREGEEISWLRGAVLSRALGSDRQAARHQSRALLWSPGHPTSIHHPAESSRAKHALPAPYEFGLS